MKKIIIVIILICFSLLGISQTYPTPYQSLGSLNIAVRDTGGLFVRQTLVMPVYTDTAAANTMGYPKNYAGSQIFTSGNNKFWIRNFSKTAWINVGSGSGGSATWQDVLTNSPDLTTDNYPNLNYKAFQMSHVGTYSITNSTVSSSHESHIVMDSTQAEISNRDATLTLRDDTAILSTKIQFPHYATSDTDKVAGFDGSGNIVLRTKSGGGGSGWSLTGNAGTTSANFIGTLDAQPFRIVVNNDTVGKWLLNYNMGLGFNSLLGLTSGTQNIGLGYESLLSITSGSENFAVGNSALGSITSGSLNIAIGSQSQYSNISGQYNMGIGDATLNINDTGDYNSAIGGGAFSAISGSRNTGVGGNVFSGLSYGNNNTGIGYGVNSDSTLLINSTAIGYLSMVNQSNSMVLGSINGVNGATASTNVGIGTTTPTATLDIDGSIRFRTGGTAGYVLTSDANGNATWQSAGVGTGWGLNGNAGITSANYLGTSDGADLNIKALGAGITDSSDTREIVTTGGDIHLNSAYAILLSSGNNEIILNGVDTSTNATDSILTLNSSSVIKKRAVSDFTNYWTKSGDDIYNNNTIGNVGIGTSTPGYSLDVRGVVSTYQLQPYNDSAYVLGTSSLRWREGWFIGNGVHIGNVNVTDSGFAAGKVLTGSSSGKAVWQTPTATGTVTSISTGLGLSGGTITTSGTLLVDTANASILSRQRAANTYTLISDTSLFSRKSMPSYSIRVNNTNATANATTDNFRTVGETSLASTDTVTWSGSTAPSGGTSNTYRWTQIGNRVWVDITLSNTTNGSVTGVVVKLPTSLPTPAEPTGQTGANQYMYPATFTIITATNTVVSAATRGGIRNNSVNNAYEVAMTCSTGAFSTTLISFTYTTN